MTALQAAPSLEELIGHVDHLVLSGVSWQTYQALLDRFNGRRLRHAFDRGRLEFMTRSSEHEIFKSLLGMMVVILAEEFGRPLFLGGEWTIRREDLKRGLEPDQCYWIANEAVVRGRTDLDLAHDPPPDLFVEVEISRTLVDRLAILAVVRVPEVWRFDGASVQVGLLHEDGNYRWGGHSIAFPNVSIPELATFLRMAGSADHLSILRSFRAWVRGQVPGKD